MVNTKVHESLSVPRTTLSLSITVEDKKTLKKYAADHETTIASVIHQWIYENCIKGVDQQ